MRTVLPEFCAGADGNFGPGLLWDTVLEQFSGRNMPLAIAIGAMHARNTTCESSLNNADAQYNGNRACVYNCRELAENPNSAACQNILKQVNSAMSQACMQRTGESNKNGKQGNSASGRCMRTFFGHTRASAQWSAPYGGPPPTAAQEKERAAAAVRRASRHLQWTSKLVRASYQRMICCKSISDLRESVWRRPPCRVLRVTALRRRDFPMFLHLRHRKVHRIRAI